MTGNIQPKKPAFRGHSGSDRPNAPRSDNHGLLVRLIERAVHRNADNGCLDRLRDYSLVYG